MNHLVDVTDSDFLFEDEQQQAYVVEFNELVENLECRLKKFAIEYIGDGHVSIRYTEPFVIMPDRYSYINDVSIDLVMSIKFGKVELHIDCEGSPIVEELLIDIEKLNKFFDEDFLQIAKGFALIYYLER